MMINFKLQGLVLLQTSLVALMALSVGCQSLRGGGGFKPMAHKVEDLENGMKILWIEDGKIPYFSMKLMLPTGSASDPDGLEGAAHLTASLLDKGTRNRTAIQISNDLELLGLSFGASADEDYTMVGIGGLSIHSEKSIQEMFDLLTNADFKPSEVNRQLALTVAQVQKMFDNPKAVASVAFEKTLYDNHPYAKLGSGNRTSLKKIKRSDLVGFYESAYQPKGAVLAVVGKFGEEQKSLIRKLYSSWKPSQAKELTLSSPQPRPAEIVYVEKPGLKQAEIRFGHLGISRNDPDYLQLRVANTILGASFIGKLFTEIRAKRGLTYSIYSYFDSREVQGPFVIATFTRLDKITEMVREVGKVYSDFTSGVSESEVKDAVAYLKGSFPQIIETGDDLANQLLILYRYGIDPNYLADFMSDVSKVTHKELNGVIKKHFRPSDLSVVIYGPPGGEIGLEAFGKVKKIKPNSLY
ncbi:insulinase family protein [bacterium]|nr:insulinase family protein [bacterium]